MCGLSWQLMHTLTYSLDASSTFARIGQHAQRMHDSHLLLAGLHCSPQNTAAIQLYKGMGYKPTNALENPLNPYLNVSTNLVFSERLKEWGGYI